MEKFLDAIASPVQSSITEKGASDLSNVLYAKSIQKITRPEYLSALHCSFQLVKGILISNSATKSVGKVSPRYMRISMPRDRRTLIKPRIIMVKGEQQC